MIKTFEKMNTEFLSMDWEIEVMNVKTLSGDPISVALGTLNGGTT